MRQDEDPAASDRAPSREDADEQIVRVVVEAAYQVHSGIGPGLLESAYEAFLEAQLRFAGLDVQRQLKVPAEFRGVRVEAAFRIDLLVGRRIVVEVKSVEALVPQHTRQLLTYLRLMNLRLGLLINFNQPLLKDGIARIVNGY